MEESQNQKVGKTRDLLKRLRERRPFWSRREKGAFVMDETSALNAIAGMEFAATYPLSATINAMEIQREAMSTEIRNLRSRVAASEDEMAVLRSGYILARDSAPQPTPMGNGQIVFDSVMDDFKDRYEMGLEKYGTPLRTNNGRHALVDLYQELQDACLYIKQFIMEHPEVAPGKASE